MTDSNYNEEVVLFQLEDSIGWITLNRPEVLNALSLEVLEKLSFIFDDVKVNQDVKAVVITGAGEKAFSAGANIQYLNHASPLEVQTYSRLAVTVTNKIENLGKVVIAAINGYALGGGLEIAEACMLRIAVSDAQLGHPEVRIGAVAGFGGTTRLPRLIGKGRATELLLTGNLISAQEAQQLGLVNRVVEADQLMKETKSLLDDILTRAPVAVGLTWEALHRGLNMTLEESAMLGADYFGLVASTEDFREGTRAFLEKATPKFLGK
ncbi:3-hydroxypropionyl-coenzyme A dehydratase [Hyella patelloides LEGE 07179]|uniref:3-hydroxypropionyl-coenzyme A dehydratase n=1 Tax=Hyella patelloides LEGE 07179 TaxID=945734 RepID=A0A563VRQ7_9CYAN|nr:enoyl-CoA hydratase-related protein [Hyella patelloides]VEP14140.1 3-hydroxypropionyl-coenzyme A dehydratase [Hyella patelloides LEGE 07179]